MVVITTTVSPRVVYFDSLVITRVTLQALTAIPTPMIINIFFMVLDELRILLSEDVAIEGFVLVLGIKRLCVSSFLLGCERQ